MKPDEYGVRLDDMVGNHPGATTSQQERLPGADCALGENGLKLEKKERIYRLSPQAMKNKAQPAGRQRRGFSSLAATVPRINSNRILARGAPAKWIKQYDRSYCTKEKRYI